MRTNEPDRPSLELFGRPLAEELHHEIVFADGGAGDIVNEEARRYSRRDRR